METWGLNYWPIFLIVSTIWLAIGFGIPEGIALAEHVSGHLDNTLSQYARVELGVAVSIKGTIHTIAWWCSFVTYMIFTVFIIGHIWFDQFG
jgi:hypothetical protein